ncbi:MAG: peptidylprolyl isomerase [Deltaproteobacteria bacterium]|nr:peptidylprolyl isomerase [Deltaproteobacteria bacterium]
MKRTSLFLVLALAACQRNPSRLDDMKAGSGAVATKTATGSATVNMAPAQDIDSHDILNRTETADEVVVKHVLISWKDLGAIYRGQQDQRGKDRSNADAAKLAQDVLSQLKADPSKIDALVQQYGEDPGAKSGDPYTVNKETSFVPEFKNLALRLKEKEAGIVKTQFGYHVIQRVAPPPPDPIESADILARPAEKGPVSVLHVLIGYKDAPAARDPKAKARSKEDATKMVQEVLTKAKSGTDFKQLMKEYSEDPGSKDSGRPYDVTADAPMVEPFKKLSLRLKENEIGVVKTPFGFHVIKRMPPPPPDSLDSADILKRDPVTQKAKVKHILLGWTDNHTEDPRGTKRTRAELEKLVKDTVAKLKKGDKIEPLMAELSEDPGSAKSGQSYDVTPDAGLVEPFKNLSLRLNKDEVGVVKTQFGIHIIQRVE